MSSIMMNAGSDRCCCPTCGFQVVVDLKVQEAQVPIAQTEQEAGIYRANGRRHCPVRLIWRDVF